MQLSPELIDVAYTAGKVFDNLGCSRHTACSVLSTGATTDTAIGTADQSISAADLALLEDLRDGTLIAQKARTAGEPVTANLLVTINAAMNRSAALHPGSLRTADQHIGVNTAYGRHAPLPQSLQSLDQLIATTLSVSDPAPSPGVLTDHAYRRIAAARQFVPLATAQPFEDGNKRTALLAANVALGQFDTLRAPYNEDAPQVADRFHDLHARAYIFGEIEPAADYLVTNGTASTS